MVSRCMFSRCLPSWPIDFRQNKTKNNGIFSVPSNAKLIYGTSGMLLLCRNNFTSVC